ncbi:hypothetical protein [Paracoccus aerodenitrificans]|uniref:hypothetical protein n=1 Tax=Paracoccus aerodenitrificans TaxID=3017781 RepID=UPI0022EFE2BD|nr:hypothetical protein [Paracoccus aerodenitrificans]WBU63565.1 hypothetical protein PAE61_14585 [Paracoccus aerodenitrificans]
MAKLVLNTTTDLLKVPAGAGIKLHDGRTGKVEENMGDGQWLNVLFDDDDMELVHSQDIAEVHEPE